MKKNILRIASTTLILATNFVLLESSIAAECSDRSAMEAAMNASGSVVSGDSFKLPRVLKRHHPSKRKEVATYFRSGDLYYTLFWIVSDDCTASFVKRTKGKY